MKLVMTSNKKSSTTRIKKEVKKKTSKSFAIVLQVGIKRACIDIE